MKPMTGPPADDREMANSWEMNTAPTVSDDRQDQDDEAPHREHVRGTGHGPLEQLLLPEHLGRLGLRRGWLALRTVHRGRPEVINLNSVQARRPATAEYGDDQQPTDDPPDGHVIHRDLPASTTDE